MRRYFGILPRFFFVFTSSKVCSPIQMPLTAANIFQTDKVVRHNREQEALRGHGFVLVTARSIFLVLCWCPTMLVTMAGS